MIFHFLHRIKNPHCAECAQDLRCKNCDTLRELLDSERYNNKQLLNSLLEQFAPKPVLQQVQQEQQVPVARSIPWRVRQQMLEAEDRKKAELIREQNRERTESRKSTEELEKELGISDAS